MAKKREKSFWNSFGEQKSQLTHKIQIRQEEKMREGKRKKKGEKEGE